MSIRKRLAIRSAGAWTYLPPFNAECAVSEIREKASHVIPFAGMSTPYSKRHGWVIGYAANGVFASVSAALTFRAALRAALDDSDGYGQSVDIAVWHDDAGSQTEIYRGCRLDANGLTFEPDGNTLMAARIEFTLESDDPGEFTTTTDGAVPGAGTWESYIASGAAAGTVTMGRTLTIPFDFDGAAAATVAGNVATMQRVLKIPATPPTAWTVKRLAVSGALATEDGTTVLRVADGNYAAGATNYIALTLAVGDYNGFANGSFSIAADGLLYVYVVSAAGKHANISGSITLEAA